MKKVWKILSYILLSILMSLIVAGLANPAFAQKECGKSYRVKRGDSLNKIARKCSITLSTIVMANPQLENIHLIYSGQLLHIPRKPELISSASPTLVIRPEEDQLIQEDLDQLGIKKGNQEHWIDVDLSSQTVSAYTGQNVVKTFLVSTGTYRTPTIVGKFIIYLKLETDDMRGDDYFLKDVPFTMYFHKGYGLHGTYWHDSFGQPMSHGCVNLSVEDAEWLFEFTSIGTLVNVHY